MAKIRKRREMVKGGRREKLEQLGAQLGLMEQVSEEGCYERFNQTFTRCAIAGSVQTYDSQVSNLEGDRDEQIARLRDSVTEMQAELGKLRNMRETIDRLYSLAENVSRGLELLESQPQASR